MRTLNKWITFAPISRSTLHHYVSATVVRFSRPHRPVRLSRRARLKEVMRRGSGALRIVVDCSLDDAYTMSEKVRKSVSSVCL